MRINEFTKVIGEKVVLVPYRKTHVEKYHKWMESAELRELTSSDRLSLEEEYSMQKSWLNDEDKCTFIVLDKAKYMENCDEIENMIGDVNLYISKVDGYDVGEMGLMIAESSYRSQGRGKEAAILMMKYGYDVLKIDKYVVKISTNNSVSIKMFLKLLFEVENENDIFKETTLLRNCDQDFKRWLELNISSYCLEDC